MRTKKRFIAIIVLMIMLLNTTLMGTAFYHEGINRNISQTDQPTSGDEISLLFSLTDNVSTPIQGNGLAGGHFGLFYPIVDELGDYHWQAVPCPINPDSNLTAVSDENGQVYFPSLPNWYLY
jgi:hypothetical protein